MLNPEEARLLYVAATRARKLLVVPSRLARKWNVAPAPAVAAAPVPAPPVVAPARAIRPLPPPPAFAKVIAPPVAIARPGLLASVVSYLLGKK